LTVDGSQCVGRLPRLVPLLLSKLRTAATTGEAIGVQRINWNNLFLEFPNLFDEKKIYLKFEIK